jgi:hypothetical protein
MSKGKVKECALEQHRFAYIKGNDTRCYCAYCGMSEVDVLRKEMFRLRDESVRLHSDLIAALKKIDHQREEIKNLRNRKPGGKT